MILVRRFASRAAADGGLLARVAQKMLVDIAQLGCAFLLFASPFWFAFRPIPAWDLWIAGYAMVTFSVAALVAEAEWEPQANLMLGLWLLAAPWMLGFSHETTATLVHFTGGVAISVLSAFELWRGQENPPKRFGPAAARRPDLISVVSATAPAGYRQVIARARHAGRSSRRRYAFRVGRHRPESGTGCTGFRTAGWPPGDSRVRSASLDLDVRRLDHLLPFLRIVAA